MVCWLSILHQDKCNGQDGTVNLSDNDINIKGNFIIASIEEVSPAQDDATYSISLENDGEPEIYPGKDDE